MIKKCPNCNSTDIKVKYSNLTDKNYFIDGKFSLILCNKCKLEFLDPLLTEQQVERYYPKEDYYSFYDYNKMALAYHKLSAYYYSKKNKLFNILFYIFSPIFYTYYIEKGKSVLEIGCGNGMKLAIYQKYGMKTYGLEPYLPKVGDRERKLGIEKKSVKDAGYKENSFDYIILKEVLEHVPDQELVLSRAYSWLKPGGKLIITVPNTKGLWRNMFKENWYGYDVPRHFYNYNPKNLAENVKRFGFKIKKIRIYDMPYMFDGSLKFKYPKNNIIFSNITKIIAVPISLAVTNLKKGSLIEMHCTK